MMHATIGDNSTSIRNNDWIAVYRNLRTHPIIGFLNSDGTRRKNAQVCQSMAWIDLCMEANWKDRHENNNGQLVLVERGQLQGGRKWLADRWGWTENQVRWFLKKLQDEGMIMVNRPKITPKKPEKSHSEHTLTTTTVTTNRTTSSAHFVNVITVCNYNIYQAAYELYDMLNNQSNHQSNHQSTTNQPPHSNKETNKQYISPIGDLSSEAKTPERKTLKAAEAARMAFDRYNEIAKRLDLPIAKMLTAGRKQKIVARIKDAGGWNGFEAALANLEASDFLQGKNNNGFRADFDFLCQAKSFGRLLDGGYGKARVAACPGKPKTKDEMTLIELQAHYDRGGV